MKCRRVLMLVLAAAVALAGPAGPTEAQQRLFHQTEDGWFVYVEERSCVAYFDYEQGADELMLRLSNRTDEGHVYFNVVASSWSSLSSRVGEGIYLGMFFPELNRGLLSPGMVIRNTDGRYGYTAREYAFADIERLFSTMRRMEIRVMTSDGSTQTVSYLPLRGAAVGMMQLARCNDEHFGGRQATSDPHRD